MSSITKQVKDLGWDYISLTQKGFKGAVQNYTADNGSTVAVGFNMHEAFVIEDEQGLFALADIKAGVIQDKHIDIEATGEIEGLTTIAWEDEGEFGCDEEKLTALGINVFEVKESLKNRILHLAKLDQFVDVPLN